jgi:hypothetical protein
MVIRTTDGGANWVNLRKNLAEALGPSRFVRTLIVHPWFPSLVYAGTEASVMVLVQ